MTLVSNHGDRLGVRATDGKVSGGEVQKKNTFRLGEMIRYRQLGTEFQTAKLVLGEAIA
jgi:hypothetical protein